MGTKYYKNKYRIESTRLKNYDYSSDGAYFITICTKNRNHYFGEIVNAKMELTDIGKIAWEQWFLSEKIRTNIILDEFIVMPNHIHAIIVIDNNKNQRCRDVVHNVSTESTRKNYHGNHKIMSDISPIKKSISHMVREFKSAITRNGRKINPNFGWQTRFWDHIIRNDAEFHRIKKYIIENPEKWWRDRNNTGIWM